jgi:hypothetical protein
MGKSTHVNTKTPKKRAAVTGDLVGVRVQPDMAKQLDDWRRKQDDLPGRPEAIRRLVELGLRAKGKWRAHVQRGALWTLTDDDMLCKLLASGMKAPAIALKMNRTVGAIQSRKSELKAKGKSGKTQSE